MVIASAAQPGAASHHPRLSGDRQRGAAGRSGSPPSAQRLETARAAASSAAVVTGRSQTWPRHT
ncbi:hypothetical protein CKJ61_05520 [Mycobacterium intracellulare]|nr:hypothetical protein CKJ61_05520 [Mycobacterium intracellulare]